MAPRPPSSPRVVALCVVASLCRTAPAEAQPASWSLAWAAPGDCPSETSLRAQVEAMVGARSGASSPVRMTARVAPSDGHWSASLTTEVRGAPGSRTLAAPTCRALADAVAVILAWMIDASTRTLAAAPEPSGALSSHAVTPNALANALTASALTASATAASAAPIAATDPPPPPPIPGASLVAAERAARALFASPPWRVGVALGARGDLGALPAFAVGPTLRVSLLRGRWRLFVDGSWRPTVHHERSSAPSVGGDFDLWTVGLGVCHRWVSRTVTPALCSAVEGGALSAVGFGVTRPGSNSQAWVAVSAGGALEFPLRSWLTLSARASASVPLVRPDFTLQGVGDVFQPSVVGLRSEIDVEVTF